MHIHKMHLAHIISLSFIWRLRLHSVLLCIW